MVYNGKHAGVGCSRYAVFSSRPLFVCPLTLDQAAGLTIPCVGTQHTEQDQFQWQLGRLWTRSAPPKPLSAGCRPCKSPSVRPTKCRHQRRACPQARPCDQKWKTATCLKQQEAKMTQGSLPSTTSAERSCCCCLLLLLLLLPPHGNILEATWSIMPPPETMVACQRAPQRTHSPPRQ